MARQKTYLSQIFSDIIYSGRWFTDLREALVAFMGVTQKYVTGTLRVRLYKGQCVVTGRRSPYSLYEKKLATYGAGDAFQHAAAQGFLEILQPRHQSAGFPARAIPGGSPQRAKSMNAEVLSIGSELMAGRIADTNAAYLSEQLQLLGFDVTRHTTVGDRRADIKRGDRGDCAAGRSGPRDRRPGPDAR